MAKVVDYFASIKTGTDRVIGQTDNDWATVRDGSHLKFVNDPVHYLVANTNKYFYIKPFTSTDGKSILISEDTGVEILINDAVVITYKEYEIIDVTEIINGGTGYSVGDSLQLNEFTPSINNYDNTLGFSRFRVDGVDAEGVIKTLLVDERGAYNDKIDDQMEVGLSGGTGSGAKIRVLGNLKESRGSVERFVSSIERGSDGGTKVHLNYSIPKEIKDGKISVHKYELRLSSDYKGQDKIEQVCTITRDFSSNFKFPLMAANSLNGDVAHNESVLKIDSLLSALQKKVDFLESKIESLEDK